MRSCLREQQQARRGIKVRLEGALITSGSGSTLPPMQSSFRGLSLLGRRCSRSLTPNWSGETCPADPGGS